MSAICPPALPARRAISFGFWACALGGGVALFAATVVVGRRIDFSALTTAQIAWGWIAASLVLNLASILGMGVGLGLVSLAREGLTFGGARSLVGDDEVGLAVPRTIPAHATMSV